MERMPRRGAERSPNGINPNFQRMTNTPSLLACCSVLLLLKRKKETKVEVDG